MRDRFASPGTVKVVWRSPTGEVLGAGLATVEGEAAEITFLHIVARHATTSASGAILDQLMAALPAGVRKVLAQGSTTRRWVHLLEADARAVLLARNFRPLDRILLAVNLARARVDPPRTLPAGYSVGPLKVEDVEALGRFAFEAYRGSVDAGIVTLAETEEAYLRLYRRFLSGEFGAYLRELSFQAGAPDGSLAGVLHTLDFGERAYVGDLSVLGEHRGKGLGRALLSRALAAYQAGGYRQAALTATAQNTPAYRLYQAVGFEVERSNEVFLLYR